MERSHNTGLAGEANRKAAETVPHVYFETDLSGTLIFLNSKGSEVLGYTDADIRKGLLLEKIVPRQDRARFRDDFNKTIHGQETLAWSGYTFVAKDGMAFPGLIYPQVTTTEKGTSGVRGLLAVVDDQERLQNLLKRERLRTEEYFDLSATLLLRRDLKARITEINKTGCDILECTEEEALGKDWIETFVLPEDRPAVRANFEDLIQGNLEPYRHRPARRIVTKKGTVKLMNWRNRLMKTRKGVIAGVVSSGEDVTERLRLEKELRESEEKYRSIFNESRDGKVLVNAETGQIVECNREFERQTGRSSEDLQKLKIWEIRPEKHIAAAQKAFHDMETAGDIGIVRTEYQKPDGSSTPIEFTSREITIGDVRYFQSISRDISSRIEAENRLQESELQFHNLYDQMLEGVIYVGLEGEFVSMNASAARILGPDAETLKHYHDLLSRFHPVRGDGAPYTEDLFPGITALHTGIPERDIIMGLRRGDNVDYQWLAGTCVPEFREGESVPYRVFFTFSDVTERHRIARELEASEKKFSSIFEHAPEAILIMDSATGLILEANRSAVEMSGYAYHELVGRDVGQVDAWADREELDRFRSLLEKSGKVTDFEYQFRRKNGDIITVSMTVDSVVLNGVPCYISIQSDITARKQVEKTLRESEEKFFKMFSSSPDAIVLTNLTNNVMMDVNDAMLKMTGYSREEVIGHTAAELKLWKNPGERLRVVSTLQRNGSIDNEELEFRVKNGELRTVLFSARLLDQRGEKFLLSVLMDITDRKQAERTLQESERKFSTIFQTGPDAIAMVARSGKYLDTNQAFLDLFGYTREEVIGHTPTELKLWTDNSKRLQTVQEIEEKGQVSNREVLLQGKDGTIHTVLFYAKRITIGNQPVVMTLIIDITDRVEAEKALRESEEKFSHIFHQLPEAITFVDVGNGVVLEANDSAIAMSGYERDQIVGHTLDQVNFWVDNEARARILAALEEKGEVSNEETEFRRKNGEIITVSFSAQRMVINGVLYEVSIQTDITERKRAERQLRESEEKFSTIFQTSPDTMIVVSVNKKFEDVNQAFLDHFGYARDEVIGQSADSLGIWMDRRELRRMKSAIDKKGHISNMEAHFRHKNGDISTVLFSARKTIIGGRSTVISVTTDITDRVEAEKALRESEEKFAKAFMASPDGIAITNDTGVFLEINEAFTNIFGFTREEVIGHTTNEFNGADSLEEGMQRVAQLEKEGRLFALESEFVTKSGDKRIVLFSMERIVLDGEPCWISVSTDITERKKAEEALAVEAARRRILMEQSKDGIVILREDGSVYEANRRFAEMLGYTAVEMQHLMVWDWDHINTREQLRVMLSLVDEKGEHFETVHRRKDGSLLDVEISTNGAIIGDVKLIFCIVRDISARKQAEQDLRDSEEKFAVAFHANPDPIAIADDVGNFIDVKAAFTKNTGFTREQVANSQEAVNNFFPVKEERDEILRMFYGEGSINNYECRVKYGDGSVHTALFTVSPITLAGKKRYLGMTHDITERKIAEEALRQSEERFSIAFHSSPDAIIITTREGKYLDINKAYERMYGYKREEKIGTYQAHDNFVDPLQAQEINKIMMERGRVNDFECRIRSRSGKVLDVLLSIQPINLAGTTCLLGISHDITERKLAEQALRDSEEKFSVAFHASPDSIVITDEDGKYIDVNRSFEKATGHTLEEIREKKEEDFTIFPDPKQREDILNILFNEGRVENYECQMIYAENNVRTVQFSILPVALGGRRCFVGITHDITEMRLAEKAIRESEERFSIAFHSSPQMAIITDIDDGTYYEANEAFCKATGYSMGEVIGNTGAEINLWVDTEAMMRFARELLEKGSVKQGEYRMRMRNGEIRIWLCSAEFIMLHGKRSMLAVASDITERIQAEEEVKELYEQEASLRQKLEDEMKRRAEFTRALVHELKTPLTPIVASSDSLADIITEEPLRSMAINVNRGALNLNKRIDELLELARSELNVLQINPSILDIDTLMRQIISEMEPMADKHRQRLNLELPEPMPVIEADPERVRQVISNLLTNSLKFTQEGGEITLRGMYDKENITVEVQDNGRGLSKGELDRLFQPYYRKESDREHLSGLGLGLALCKTLVEHHGGEIWARSEEGKGSLFGFTLPRKSRTGKKN